MNFDSAVFIEIIESALDAQRWAAVEKGANPCAVENCNAEAYATGLCNAHYIRKRQGRDMAPPIRARKRSDTCSECGEATGKRGGWGLCSGHYKKKRVRVIKAALVEAMGGACSRCGGVFPLPCFDFHHTAEKTSSPSSLIANNSPETIAQELAGCSLLCANCHRITHHEEGRDEF